MTNTRGRLSQQMTDTRQKSGDTRSDDKPFPVDLTEVMYGE